MQLQEENQPYDEINVTPMLDLAYVLLVIFIIMCTASVQGVKVNLPRTTITTNIAKSQTKAVTVNERGDIFLDAYPINMDLLETRVGQMKSANPALSIIVKGDGKVHFGKVMAVLDLLKRMDITDVGLVTVRLKEG